MTEDRAAQTLNITVAALLGTLILGFFAWSALTGFSRVCAIYRLLPSNEQNDVEGFLGSLEFLAIGSTAALTILSRSKHPAIKWLLHVWPIWALASGGAVSLGLGFRMPGYVWLAASAVFLAGILINRWRNGLVEKRTQQWDVDTGT